MSQPLVALLQSTALPHASHPAILWAGAAYFVVVLAIGAWATKRTRTAGDFFVAGRGIGLWALAISAMAATLSGFAFIGGPGLVYALGFGAVFLVLPATLTNSLTAWVLAKRLRLLGEVRGLITVPDAIGARFRSPAAQGLSGVAILIAVIGYMATNLLALGIVVDAIFGVGLGWGIWIGMGITLAYSAAGGIIAGIYTDLVQGALMAVASTLVFVFAMQAGGGMAAISSTILASDPEFLAPWGVMTPLAALSLFFVFGIGVLGQPHVVHKFYMLKDPRLLKWYPLLMTLALVVSLLLFFAVGVSMKALVERGSIAPLVSPDQATPLFLLTFAPTILAALVFAGAAAAIMSTVNSFVNVGAAAVTHDIPKALGRRVGNELLWGRLTTAAICVAGAALAHASGTLVAFLGIFGWGLFASTLVPSLGIGLNWPSATRAGAIASITTGLVTTLVLETLAYLKVFSLPAGVSATGLALVTSMLVFFAVSAITRAGGGDDIDPDVRLIMDS